MSLLVNCESCGHMQNGPDGPCQNFGKPMPARIRNYRCPSCGQEVQAKLDRIYCPCREGQVMDELKEEKAPRQDIHEFMNRMADYRQEAERRRGGPLGVDRLFLALIEAIKEDRQLFAKLFRSDSQEHQALRRALAHGAESRPAVKLAPGERLVVQVPEKFMRDRYMRNAIREDLCSALDESRIVLLPDSWGIAVVPADMPAPDVVAAED